LEWLLGGSWVAEWQYGDCAVSIAAAMRESRGTGLGASLHGENPSRRRNSQERNPYASSWTLRCGKEATIAGQATMATKARATRMSCIVDSFRETLVSGSESRPVLVEIKSR
jgi:hypothetical protein